MGSGEQPLPRAEEGTSPPHSTTVTPNNEGPELEIGGAGLRDSMSAEMERTFLEGIREAGDSGAMDRGDPEGERLDDEVSRGRFRDNKSPTEVFTDTRDDQQERMGDNLRTSRSRSTDGFAKYSWERDASPPSLSSSSSGNRKPRSPASPTGPSYLGTSLHMLRTHTSPTQPRPTSAPSNPTRSAPAFRRAQSYVTSSTNQATTSALASGHGHMLAGADEPSDIRRPRSNSHSAPGDFSRPHFSSRPGMGLRVSSAVVEQHRNSNSPTASPPTFSYSSSPSPTSQDHVDMLSPPFMALQQRRTFSPDSDRDSAEMSPDADDEASPQHSPANEPERLSPSPEGAEGEEAEFESDVGQRQREGNSPVFGQADSAEGDMHHDSTGIDLSLPDDQSTAFDGVMTDPDVEGLPEALSMPRDMMPSEDAFEDEGLTTLERIFLLSRSEHAFHRSYIARMMGELLEDVDPCETVEYVLPLLNGFAMDEDESVKEAFASQLHRVLWYYFTTCDLIGEDDGAPLEEFPSAKEVITVTSEGVRTVRRTRTFTADVFPMVPPNDDTAITSGSEEQADALLSASDPSPVSAGSADSRKASEPSTLASSITQTVGTPSSTLDTPSSTLSMMTGGTSDASANAGFKDTWVEEVKDKDRSSDDIFGPTQEDEERINVERPQIPVHMFTALVGSMLLSPNPAVADPVRAAIVAILAKLRHADTPLLDEWEDVRPRKAVNTYHGQFGEHVHLSNKFSGTSRKMVQNEIMHGIVIGMGRLDAELPESMRQHSGSKRRVSGEEDVSESGSMASSTSRNARPGLSRAISRSSAMSAESPSITDSQSTDIMAYKQQLQQEALMGRAISMNLIASISEFVTGEDIMQYGLLDEVLRTAEDDAYVKIEGALALAFLAKTAPLGTLDNMLGLFENFVMDESEQVRQSACLCLPPLCKRIVNMEDRRSYAARAFDTLINSGNLVQYTALEILGEIVHLFHGDPLGPPQELLDVYFSQSEILEPQDETTGHDTDVVRQFTDPDRAVVSAYNLPAICLALGQNRWSEIRPTFSALCNITHQRITVSLAASVHEIAKIIGPDLASQDLLLPFFEWLNGNDEIRGRALAQLPTFLGYLPADDAADTLQSVLAMWETGEFRNWRHRETLAGHAPSILMVLLPMGHGELALDLLRSGLFDTFQAIREAAIKVVPKCLNIVKGKETLHERVFSLLADLATNEKFKHRKTYIACVQAFVDDGVGRTFFEKHLLEWLPAMSDDLLDVKIALAKLVASICAPMNKGGLYPHAPLRPLRLSEAIERLMNEPSQYVQAPLADVQPYRPRLTHSQRGSQFGSDMPSPMASISSANRTPQDTTPPTARRSSSASMLLRADSDSTVMPLTCTRVSSNGFSRDEAHTAGTLSAPVALMTAPFSSPEWEENGLRRRSLSENGETGYASTGRRQSGLGNALMEPVQVGMNDPFSATFARAIQETGSASGS